MTLKTETPVRMGLIRKHDSWTTEEFRTYWREKHGPLVAKIPNLREYWQLVPELRDPWPGWGE